MFNFGMMALEKFKARLVEWPQYCHHVLQALQDADVC
jgi:hypothetical protein